MASIPSHLLRIALPLAIIVSIALFLYFPNVQGAFRTYEPGQSRGGGNVELASSADDSLLRGNMGDPTMDRLQPHLSYLTAGKGAGLTNQVWAMINTLYLAYLTNRVAIIPAFWANQQILSATRIRELPVSEMFNLTRLQLEVPILRGVLEWKDIHPIVSEARWDDQSETWGQIGGWGGLQTGVIFDFAKLKVHWTPYPGTTRSLLDSRYLNWVSFVPYLLPNSPFYQSAVLNLPSSTVVPPSDHLVAIDEVLAGSELQGGNPYDEFLEGLGGWKYIGTHLHFRDELVQQAEEVLRKMFNVRKGEEIPPFIAIHIRHGDFFVHHCPKDASQACFTVSQYAYAVAQIQDGLVASGLDSTSEVLVLSDELSDEFYKEVKERGWKSSRDGRGVDDSILRKELGGWYPTILDKVLMSLASDFVGTDRSTMSVLSARRVQEWNNGTTRMVGATGPSLTLSGETVPWL